MPYMGSRLVLAEKYVLGDGAIVEMKIWEVPPSRWTPDGFKYSLVYIGPDGNRLVGYDNAEGKGHHRHDAEGSAPFQFTTIDDLVEIFRAEVEKLRRKQQ